LSLLLSIDTAGSACAVALSTSDDILAIRVVREPRSHSAKLVPLIREVVEDAGFQTRDIRAVAVSKGPGSYTGLRIGVSTAKGLAFGLDIPLVGVATFEALAWANLAGLSARLAPRTAHLLTTAVSKRNEVYWQMWQTDNDQATAQSEPKSDRYAEVADVLRKLKYPVILVGEGLEALRPVLEGSGVSVSVIELDESHLAIHGVSALGHRLLAEGRTEDVALFEPFYLKEFVARKGRSPFEKLPF